jgi:hypothetical protein
MGVGGCFVLLTWAYDAFERGNRLRVTVPALPHPSGQETPGTYRFKVTESGYWSTDRYEYLYLEGRASVWENIWWLLRHRVPGGGARIVLRIHDRFPSGTLSIPGNVDGYLFLFSNEGTVVWMLGAGRLDLGFGRDGSLAALEATLTPAGTGGQARPGDDGCELRLATHEVPMDLGTALKIFGRLHMDSVTELRHWLAEDPDLDDLLPGRTLRDRLVRAERTGKEPVLPAPIEKAILRRLCHDEYWSGTSVSCRRDVDLTMRVSLIDGGFHARIDQLDASAATGLKHDLWGMTQGPNVWITRDYVEEFDEKMTGATEAVLRLPARCSPEIDADSDFKETILAGVVSAARREFCSGEPAAAPSRFLLADFNVDSPETYILAGGIVYDLPLVKSRQTGERMGAYRLAAITDEERASDLREKIERRPLRYRLAWIHGTCSVTAEKP